MDRGPGRNVAERKRISGPNVGAGARLQAITDLDPDRGKDVGLFAVGVMEKHQPGIAVGVVLIAATFAGMSSLRRRKSTWRYRCLLPPPR